MPDVLLKQVLIAGALLFVMSTIDTLAYGVRTAGVLTRRLAISLALFNVLVIVSRLGNMVQAPIIGNLPDKVFRGAYTSAQVLHGLRIDVGFVIGGVLFGAILTPSFINIAKRGIALMEERGSMPSTIFHGVQRLHRLPHYFRWPFGLDFKNIIGVQGIPIQFLVWNIFVTCFYTIGVMSTVLAASLDHSVSGTAILLSGIVNGIATMLLFLIVDPPAAVVVDQCINGKRPQSHANTINLYLVLTRLLGCLLALVMLPPMGHYVLSAAHFVDRMFPAAQEAPSYLAEAKCVVDGLDYHFGVSDSRGGYLLEFRITNPGTNSRRMEFSSAARTEFTLRSDDTEFWSSHTGRRFTQALESEEILPGGSLSFTADWQRSSTNLQQGLNHYWFTARIFMTGTAVSISVPVELDDGDEET